MGRISRRHFVGGAVAAASLSAGRLGRPRPAQAQSLPGNPLDTFQYVVVLMLENRTFDNLLGYLYASGEARMPFAGVEGQNLCNPIPAGAPAPVGVTSVCVTPNTGQQKGDYNKPYPDPGEVYPNVNTQLYNVVAPPFNVPGVLPLQAPMTGFVTDYINNYPPDLAAPPSYDQYRIIMECFAREAVPVLSTLAREFAVFDHWFCSVPSQTLCNRAFWHAATSGGHVVNPMDFSGFEQWWEDNLGPTLFDVISLAPSDQGLDWRIYSSNLVSVTRLTHEIPLAPFGSEHFPTLEQFFTDCANGQLKAYSFLEPLFFTPNNDQHPPSYDSSVWGPFDPGAVLLGEVLINRVYNAIRTSNSATGNKWENTLLIITHDEHGGCYDHVPPPSATPPGGFSRNEDDFAFDRLGVRVPMVMISAHINAGTIVNNVYEHTSFISTMMAKWGLTWNNLPYLTQRDRHAPTFGEVFTLSTPRDPSTWPVIPDPLLPVEWLDIDYSSAPLNELQRSILVGAAARTQQNAQAVERITTTGEALAFLHSLPTRPGANPPPHRAFWLQPQLRSVRATLGGGETPAPFNDVDTFTFRGYRRERIKILLFRAQRPGTQQGSEAALAVHAPGGQLIGQVRGALPLILSLQLPTAGTYSISVSDQVGPERAFRGDYELYVHAPGAIQKTLRPGLSVE